MLGRFLSFTGRTGRGGYLIANIVVYALMYGGGFVLMLALMGLHADLPARDRLDFLPPTFTLPGVIAWPMAVFGGVAIFIALVGNLAAQVRRLHDLGLTGFLVIALIVLVAITPEPPSWPNALPGLGAVLVEAVLLLVPGRRGANRYGPDPRAGGTDAIGAVFDAPSSDPGTAASNRAE